MLTSRMSTALVMLIASKRSITAGGNGMVITARMPSTPTASRLVIHAFKNR